jgi:DNA-binding transcriptional LysR family regulator
MGMELHHLRCAVAVADHGSFTRAAAALYISQPTLSYSIAKLEDELGARLFDRSHGVRLTAAGTAFLDHARRALAEAESGRSAVDAVTGVFTGELRVAGIRTAVVETARLVSRFHHRHPGVSLMVEEPSRDRVVVDMVRASRVDIGIIRSVEVPDDLAMVAAGSRSIVLIYPEKLAPAARTVALDALQGVPLIVPLPGTSERHGHEELFRNTGVVVAAECSHQDTMVELVRGGVGAAVTSSTLAAAMNTEGIAVRPLRRIGRDDLAVVRRPASSPAAEAFCALVGDLPPSEIHSGRR